MWESRCRHVLSVKNLLHVLIFLKRSFFAFEKNESDIDA